MQLPTQGVINAEAITTETIEEHKTVIVVDRDGHQLHLGDPVHF